MSFDILKPHEVKLNKSLEGQQILVYGNNSTGKSYQGSKMKKPLFLPFEDGIRTLPGTKFFPILSWSDFVKVVRQLTNPKTIDQVKEVYSTIVIDEVFTAAKYLSDFICRKHGVETIGEGNRGFGLWAQMENEWFQNMDKLMKSGFTLYFVGHEDRDKDTGQIIPKGDKRTMQFIRDNCDLVVNVQSNSIDENGNVIKSSAYLAETPQYFARSRFTHIDPYLPEFTAQALEAAVVKAIERQEEAEGIKAVSFQESQEVFNTEKLDFEVIKTELNEIANKLVPAGFMDEVMDMMEKHLGKDKKVSETKPSDVEFLSLLLIDMKEFAEDNLTA